MTEVLYRLASIGCIDRLYKLSQSSFQGLAGMIILGAPVSVAAQWSIREVCPSMLKTSVVCQIICHHFTREQ